MTIDNKLGITDSFKLANEEERISKKKAIDLFQTDFLNELKHLLKSIAIYLKTYMNLQVS